MPKVAMHERGLEMEWLDGKLLDDGWTNFLGVSMVELFLTVKLEVVSLGNCNLCNKE